MSMVAGYTVCFLRRGEVRQITVATLDEEAIEQLILAKFGESDIVARTRLDARTLEALRLAPGDWLEWIVAARR